MEKKVEEQKRLASYFKINKVITGEEKRRNSPRANVGSWHPVWYKEWLHPSGSTGLALECTGCRSCRLNLHTTEPWMQRLFLCGPALGAAWAISPNRSLSLLTASPSGLHLSLLTHSFVSGNSGAFDEQRNKEKGRKAPG